MEINKTQRDVFFDNLYKFAIKDKDIVLVVADMSAPSLDKFRLNLPEQFVNVGIAEQNAILIGAGLAKEGKKVFVYAISPFITLRCLEQIRVNCGIMNIPLNIIGMGTGFSYCSDGPTHHLIEDISIMRTIPNINIWNLTDNFIAEECIKDICEYKQFQTNYIRIDKDYYNEIYNDKLLFHQGGIGIYNNFVYDKQDYLICTNGIMAHSAINVINEIQKTNNIKIGLLDFYKIPFDKNMKIYLENIKYIFTIEEHFLNGGLGSILLEYLNENNLNIPIKRIGISNEIGYSGCYSYGGRNLIRKYYEIDDDNIAKIIKEVLCKD